MFLQKMYDITEIMHSGKKKYGKDFFYREIEKGNQLNYKSIVSHSEIFEVALNREMHLTSSLHQHPSP
jgi:hypothetical protein